MNLPKLPKRFYKEHYHKLIDKILRENKILYHTKKQPKMDMGEKDADFIPEDKK